MSFHAIMPCLQELLVATRHVLATDFKRAFFPHLDALLDDRWEAVRGGGRQAGRQAGRQVGSQAGVHVIWTRREDKPCERLCS